MIVRINPSELTPHTTFSMPIEYSQKSYYGWCMVYAEYLCIAYHLLLVICIYDSDYFSVTEHCHLH